MQSTRTVLALVLGLAVSLPAGASASSRIFFDNFDSGAPTGWSTTKCAAVTRATDGGAPRAGTHMMQCGWNGTLDWTNPDKLHDVALDSWSYQNEFLVRLWFRYDQNVDHAPGSKQMRIGFGAADEVFFACQMEQGTGATLLVAPNNLPTFWGSSAGKCGDNKWHKLEVYVKDNTTGSDGVLRVWVDGNMIREWRNPSGTIGGKRIGLNLPSNWSNNPGWAHDALNHVYFDDVEIYSDMGTGATGSMADASITVGGSTGVQQPRNLRVSGSGQ
jgi:hypothetical protein